MRDTVRQRDVLARLGGDEFALLLEHCPLERALEVAEKLRAAIQDFRFVWQEQAFSVVAVTLKKPISEHSPSASALLVQADNACYAAKDSGRDQVHVFRDDDEQVGALSGQTRWLARIEGALISSELVLHVDPVVPAGDPEQGADHYQVLLRLPDEDGELVAAASFMRAAERYGLASRIDRWLVTQVLERLADSSARHRLSVGVSARSITDPDFPSFIRRQLARTGVSGDQLGFQITETLAITILSTASAFIDELHTDGCHFCLADFGSGLSSFSYLKSLPVDYVKVDGSFVRQISDDPTDRAMVRSIADIGRVLGKRTIAESVDDRTVLARVREAGVDLVQGKVAGPTRDLRLLD
jgi:EAL domain-containing protein (putative c-di-GMP-specific phosphodiesterase class I)